MAVLFKFGNKIVRSVNRYLSGQKYPTNISVFSFLNSINSKFYILLVLHGIPAKNKSVQVNVSTRCIGRHGDLLKLKKIATDESGTNIMATDRATEATMCPCVLQYYFFHLYCIHRDV